MTFFSYTFYKQIVLDLKKSTIEDAFPYTGPLYLPSPSSYSSVGPLLIHRIKHQYLALYDFIPVDPLKFTSLHTPIHIQQF